MVQKLLYTKKLGRLLMGGAMDVTPGRYMVISNYSNKWAVVQPGRARALRVFISQREAVNFAKKAAFRKAGVVSVHTTSGDVKDIFSYR